MGKPLSAFDELVASLPQRGLEWHRETILENSRRNAPHVVYTIRDLPRRPAPCLIVSAGPSLYRQKTLERIKAAGFKGTLVATDGSYIQCLKAGIIPDFVVTLDPHPTRIVRWFGDPNYLENSAHDDYFRRQDLDIAFRENAAQQNAENIRTVDQNPVALVICTTAPQNVVERTARHPRFWFAPLVDSPAQDGLTRAICKATGCPALNTGGTVGTAAWNFAHSTLRSRHIAVVGCDLGYYLDTPLEKTQSWHMLGGDPAMYPVHEGHWGPAMTDPTYTWYRQNFIDLLRANKATVTNCTGAGLLAHPEFVRCVALEEWLREVS